MFDENFEVESRRVEFNLPFEMPQLPQEVLLNELEPSNEEVSEEGSVNVLPF